MTTIIGDTGKVAFGAYRNFITTMAVPYETLLGTPIILTGTSTTITFPAVQATDFPTFSRTSFSVKYCIMLYVSGRNQSGAAATVSYNFLKNGVSVSSGASGSVANNQNWTLSCGASTTVSVGDVFTVTLSSAGTNIDYRHYGFQVYPTQLYISKNNNIVFSNLTYNITSPTFSLGTSPIAAATGTFNVYPFSSLTNNLGVGGNFSAYTITAFSQHQTFGMGRIQYGDQDTSTRTDTHNTSIPAYRSNQVPTSITYREILR